MTDEYGLSPEEAQVLVEDRIIISSDIRSTGEKRKISGAFLTPPASQGSISSSSGCSASVRFRSFNSSPDYTLDLPKSAISVAALEFIGFTPETATEIFRRFASRPDPNINPDDLLDYVYGQTLILSNNPHRHSLPAEAMTLVGLAQQTQDAILDPQFTQIFGTETLHFWINNTLRINYLTLVQLLCRLKKHATRSKANKKAKRAKVEGAFVPQASSSSQPSSASSQQTTMTATLNLESEDHHLPKSFVTVDTASEVLQDHFILYKAKAAAEMGDPQWIRDDGSLNMATISSHGGGDFNHQNVAWYWTPEAETAETYRQWAARRCPWSDTWVIRIQIPKTFINTLRQKELWFSRDWKEYVWHCRKREEPPERFSYWEAGEADLVKGHICTGVQSSIARIKKEDVQSKMSEDNVLMTNSRKSVQWVFMQSTSVKRLGQEIRGKIHIEITQGRP